jgi:hypothetical protein
MEAVLQRLTKVQAKLRRSSSGVPFRNDAQDHTEGGKGTGPGSLSVITERENAEPGTGIGITRTVRTRCKSKQASGTVNKLKEIRHALAANLKEASYD